MIDLNNYQDNIQKTEKIVGYEFKDKHLLLRALTHPSAAEGFRIELSYERLEFLGDSLVGFIVAEKLYKRYEDVDEGQLTRMKVSLVSGTTLSEVAHEAGLESCIIFGNSELGTDARGLASALENVYESLVGALYLDGGIEVATRWVVKTLGSRVYEGIEQAPDNPKSLLQEVTQRDCHETPTYELIETTGPAHEPTFVCAAYLQGKQIGIGKGSSKKDAETQAALAALKGLK